MEKSDRWFLKRDIRNPNQMVYVSAKGEVIPVESLPTVEEKQHWDRHLKFVSLQRARDGWTCIRQTLDAFFQIIVILKLKVKKKDCPTSATLIFMHGTKFRQRILKHFNWMNRRLCLFPLNGAKALSSANSPRGALRAVSKVSTQIWAFLKNLAFEESSSHWTTLYAKHSSICLLSPSEKCSHFLPRPKFRSPGWVSENVFCDEKLCSARPPSISGLGI